MTARQMWPAPGPYQEYAGAVRIAEWATEKELREKQGRAVALLLEAADRTLVLLQDRNARVDGAAFYATEPGAHAAYVLPAL